MSRCCLPFLLIVLLASACGLGQVTQDDDRVTVPVIGLIGDSTVADTYGWGPSFQAQVAGRATVLNYAVNGATLESLDGRLDELLARHPDFVLIQFGHNDQKVYGPEEYRRRLRSYVERIRASGARPIVLSSVTRRNFGAAGKIEPLAALPDGTTFHATLPDFRDTIEALALQEGIPFIDLHTLSVAHHNAIGPKASRAYNHAPGDITHFSDQGADAVAQLVIAELDRVAPEVLSTR